MGDSCINQSHQLFLSIGNRVHDILRNVYYLHHLHVLVVYHQNLPFNLDVSCEILRLRIILFHVNLGRNKRGFVGRPFVDLMVQHKDHLFQLAYVHFAHIVEGKENLLLRLRCCVAFIIIRSTTIILWLVRLVKLENFSSDQPILVVIFLVSCL